MILFFTKLREDGQIEQVFDIEVFADTFWETEDFERAVGAAISEERESHVE